MTAQTVITADEAPAIAPPAAGEIVRTTPVVTPMQMLQVAMERGADLDRLQQLMDLQQRWEATEARKAYVAAMAVFKADPPEILKAKRVRFETSKGMTEYDHATLADVCAAATKGLAKVGISHRWDVTQDGGAITVTCVLTHQQGHNESVSMTSPPDQSGGKNSIQAIASAVTYLQRYTLLAATGLAAKDMDDDGQGAGAPAATITAEQAADLEALAGEVGANQARFLAWIGAPSFAEIPADRYRKALAGLEAKRSK
jgi:hypothetical protein